MGRHRRAPLAGIQGGQVLELDLQGVPRQDSGRSTHALDYGTAQSQMSFFPQMDGSSSSSMCPLVPRPLLGRISDEDLIILSASPNAGAHPVKGSGVQSEANEGGQMYRWNITEENGGVVIGSRHEAHRIYGKQLMYYTISRVFIGIPSVII